jgi:signal transduction histidine kinase
MDVQPVGTTVYIVDDDGLVTTSLGTALRLETPYQVETFSTAADVYAALERVPPDVVISDFKMPGTDGLALLRELRRRLPDCVLILITGYSDKDSAIAAINEVGIFQYVEKPWDLQDLLLKIKAGLERHELVRRLRRERAELASANEELRRAQERLLAAEQLAAVGRVVSGIAHEIGNQLALVGYAEAVKAQAQALPGGQGKDIAELAEVIVSAQKRLVAMVGEIRDYTRRESSGEGLPLEPADVASVIDEALAILAHDREVSARELVRQLDKRPLVRLHRGKFAQVVINLVRNAAQASPARAPIRVVLDEGPGGEVRIQVIDRGSGMPADVLARLGEPFFTTRGHRGTGLGLGISRRIVAEHGGQMAFQSAPGEGTTVTITLPPLEAAKS